MKDPHHEPMPPEIKAAFVLMGILAVFGLVVGIVTSMP